MSKRWLFVLGSLLFLSVSNVQARHNEGDPIRDGGPFGIGIEAGYPGDWGVVGKLWLTYVDALQPDVKFDGNQVIFQLDYLWHNYHLFHVHSGSLPFYIGVGGDLEPTDPAAFGVRVPIGLSYIFGHAPLDIYVQAVPTLWITDRDSAFHLYGNAGIRIYP